MRQSTIEPKETTSYITMFGEVPRNVRTYKELPDQYGQINVLIHNEQINVFMVRANS